MPEIALIGVGKDNSFGQPSDGTIERLNKIKCKILIFKDLTNPPGTSRKAPKRLIINSFGASLFLGVANRGGKMIIL